MKSVYAYISRADRLQLLKDWASQGLLRVVNDYGEMLKIISVDVDLEDEGGVMVGVTDSQDYGEEEN